MKMKKTISLMNYVILAGVFLLSVSFGLPQAKAETYTLYATDTATQNDQGETVYYGNPGDWMMIRTTPSTQGGNGFVKFDLTTIPNGYVVTSATLYLGKNSAQELPGDIGIYYSANDNWSISQLDTPIGYNPDLQLGNFHLDTPGGWYYVPIALDTSIYNFQGDINDNALTLSIVVDDSVSNPNLYAYFWGSNYTTWRPYLVIEAAPAASTDTYTFYATDSATQNDQGETVYYGDPGDWMMIRTTPSTQGGNGFVKFDLSAIPEGKAITSATLYLGKNIFQEFPGVIGIYYGANDNWSISQLENPIGFDPNLHLGNFYVNTPGGWYYIPTVLDLNVYDLQPDLDDDALTLGIVVDDSLSNPYLYGYIFGSDNNHLLYRPFLSVHVGIAAEVESKIDPIDVRSHGSYISMYVELPDGNAADIDKTTVLLTTPEGSVAALDFMAVGDNDLDGIPDAEFKFDRPSVHAILTQDGLTKLTVTGNLNDGTAFKGSDTVTVTGNSN